MSERELARMRKEFQDGQRQYDIQQRLEKGLTVSERKSAILWAARERQRRVESGTM